MTSTRPSGPGTMVTATASARRPGPTRQTRAPSPMSNTAARGRLSAATSGRSSRTSTSAPSRGARAASSSAMRSRRARVPPSATGSISRSVPAIGAPPSMRGVMTNRLSGAITASTSCGTSMSTSRPSSVARLRTGVPAATIVPGST